MRDELVLTRVPAPAPRRLRGARLLRQLHLWIGAWGAVAAILFGATGFLQNHRAILKLPQGQATDLSKVDLAIPESARVSPEAVHAWLADHRFAADSQRVQDGGTREIAGERVRQPARWMFGGGNARESWNAEYVAGNATLSLRTTQHSPLAVMSRLHKGVGGGVPWTLLTDSFAIALVALGITGLMLWARGRSARQVAFSVVGASAAAIVLLGGLAIA
jgi:hypothetical protein